MSQAGERVASQDRALLESLGARARFTWITGNHDPHPPAWLAGEVVESLRLGGLLLRHEPLSAFEPGEVAGHLHPCASAAKWGRSVRRRCFVSDGLRLIPVLRRLYRRAGRGRWRHRLAFRGAFHAYMQHATGYAMARRMAVEQRAGTIMRHLHLLISQLLSTCAGRAAGASSTRQCLTMTSAADNGRLGGHSRQDRCYPGAGERRPRVKTY